MLPWRTEDLVADLRSGCIEVELHLVKSGTYTTTAFGFLAVPELAPTESVAWVQERHAGHPHRGAEGATSPV